MELCGLLKESQSWMGIHNILDEADKIFWDDIFPQSLGQDEHKLGGFIMILKRHAAPKCAKCIQGEQGCLGVNGETASRE